MIFANCFRAISAFEVNFKFATIAYFLKFSIIKEVFTKSQM